MVEMVSKASQFAADVYEAVKKDVYEKASNMGAAIKEAPVIRDVCRETNRVIEQVRNPSYEIVESEIENLERMLNQVDLIPVASIVSGWFRMGIGATQLTAFLALNLFKDLVTAFISNEETLAKLGEQAGVETALAKNGFANVVRGLAVSSMSMNPMTIALHKLGIFTYDRVLKTRYVYPHEATAGTRFRIGLSLVEPKQEEKTEAKSYKEQLLELLPWTRAESKAQPEGK